MKKIICFLLIIINVAAYAQSDYDYNVMSYYAADNSLDGQPRIDMVNILKFYPVFAIQDSVKNVNVTVYYGNKTYESSADKMSSGKYWQTLLPDFKLGDALQRVEVEMEFTLPERLTKKLENLENNIKSIEERNKELYEQLKTNLRGLPDKIEEISGIRYSIITNIFNKTFSSVEEFQKLDRNEIFIDIERSVKYKNILGIEKNDSLLINKLKNFILFSDKFYDFIYLLEVRNSEIKTFVDINKKKENLELFKDTLTTDIFTEIIGEFADTSFSGPAIRKSDLIISEDFKSATLLYRYYKNNLRYRKALDPAESLGIFRARYVPFPIVRRSGDEFNKVELIRPGDKNAPVVFEVGLAFGDEVVSGDNTFKPALSLSRLGVAFVVTEKLFSDEANILGLALTYDFNSYASIGVGRNLAKGQSYPYYSFGINKKAFEQLLIGLGNLFK